MEIRAIIESMSLTEKATLLSGKGNWFFNGIERLSIRDLIVSDGPHGIRAYSDYYENVQNPVHKVPATAFPSASCMASTWNPSLIQSVGETIGRECNHYNVDVLLGPGVNGKRSPLGGRNFEYYSEDPYLTSEMGIAFVKGVQSQGVGTSLKHFVMNEQETKRRFISSMVDETTFREVYAYPFEKIIKKAHPLTVMAAYNRINDVYACENKDLITDLLRNDWGFQGLVISDWGGVQHKKESVLAGLDIEMPESEFTKAFIADVEAGRYPMDLIDQAVERILRAYDWILSNPNHGKTTDFETNHGIAQRVALEGIVLLKNDHECLPLNVNEKIVVIGEYAVSPKTTGGGSAELLAYKKECPLDFIRFYSDVIYYKSLEWNDTTTSTLEKADKIIVFTGTTDAIEHEGGDRLDLSLPVDHLEILHSLRAYSHKLIVINHSGSAIDVTPFINQISAFIQGWFLGSASGKAIADILFGRYNPSGRLSETFPISIKNTPTFPSFPGKGDRVFYNEGVQTGYRFYDTHDYPVQYPFGFGLSYSSFEYGTLKVSSSDVLYTDKITVSLPVTNTSSKDGQDVLQVYVRPLHCPIKWLRAFQKKMILAHQTIDFEWTLSSEAFEHYSLKTKSFEVMDGDYEILIGTSAQTTVASAVITVHSPHLNQEALQLYYPFKEWMNHPNQPIFVKKFLTTVRPVRYYEYEEPFDRIIRRLMKETGHTSEQMALFLDEISHLI